MDKIFRRKLWVMGCTAHNRIVYASALERLEFRSARSLRSHASLHHIFVIAGMLRIPLSQPQKRRIQPER